MKANFGGIKDDDGGNYAPIGGPYLVEFKDTKDEVFSDGKNPRQSFTLGIIEGEHEGKTACRDRLFFHNDACLKRAKFVYRRAAFDVDEIADNGVEVFDGVEPEELNGRQVTITTKAKLACPTCGWGVAEIEVDADGVKKFGCENTNTQKCQGPWVGPESECKVYTEADFYGYDYPSEEAAATASALAEKWAKKRGETGASPDDEHAAAPATGAPQVSLDDIDF